MVNIVIGKTLSPNEKNKIITATRGYENIVYIGPNTWDSFDTWYKLYVNGKFAGVCAVNFFRNYSKIGPLILLPQYHSRGLVHKLVRSIVEDVKQKHIVYLASTNDAVWHIAKKIGFSEINSNFKIPFSVLVIYRKISLRVLFAGEAIDFIKELFRKKKFFKREKLRHFILK